MMSIYPEHRKMIFCPHLLPQYKHTHTPLVLPFVSFLLEKTFKSWKNIYVILDQFSIWNSSTNSWLHLMGPCNTLFREISGLKKGWVQRKWQMLTWILGEWRQNWGSDIKIKDPRKKSNKKVLIRPKIAMQHRGTRQKWF